MSKSKKISTSKAAGIRFDNNRKAAKRMTALLFKQADCPDTRFDYEVAMEELEASFDEVFA